MQDLSFSSSSHPPFQPFHNPAHCIHQSQALTRNIPHSHGLVQTRRHNQVFRWVELGAHHIVIMASQNTGCQKKRIYWEMLDNTFFFFFYWNAYCNNYLVNIGKVHCKQKKLWYLNLTLVLNYHFPTLNFIATYQTQVLDCQFQMRIVWSSDALRIQGYSYREEN